MKKQVFTMIVVLVTLALAGAFAWSAWGQPAPSGAVSPSVESAAPNLPRTITVVGKGSVKIQPDMAALNLGVQTMGPTVKEATGEAAKTMEAILAALKAEGIADKDIQTSGYNVWADMGYGPERSPNQEMTYRVNNNVRVMVRDLDAVGTILDVAIEAGANAIHGVSFGLAEPETLEAEARELAAENALAKAKELAALHDVEVGQVVSISEVLSGGFMMSNFERMDTMMAPAFGAGGAGPITPGELELSMQLQVVYAIE
jgi:uncharacterized protein